MVAHTDIPPLLRCCARTVSASNQILLDRLARPIGRVRSSISGERAASFVSQILRSMHLKEMCDFQSFDAMQETEKFTGDHLDNASSNIFGALAGVLAACFLSWFVDGCQSFLLARLLQEDGPSESNLVGFIYRCMGCIVKSATLLGICRKSELEKLDLEHRLKDQRKELEDPSHPRDQIELSSHDEGLLLEAIIGVEPNNVWSVLMPAVYQLVPGSVIARFWFIAIFPFDSRTTDQETSGQKSIFANLMGEEIEFFLFRSSYSIVSTLTTGIASFPCH